MKASSVVKIVFLVLFFSFLSLYIAQGTGYYEYSRHEKMIMTKEKIEEFEEDIESGVDVDLKDYLDYEKVDYSNGISDSSLKASKGIEKAYKKGMEYFFSIILKMFSE